MSSEVTAAVLVESGRPRPYASSNPVELTRLHLDEPGPGELLVRVRAAGLCHSDLSVVNGARPRPVPMALGHEAAGEVVAVGGNSAFTPGDHVVLAFVPSCGTCSQCLDGRAALCQPGGQANRDGTLLGGGMRMSRADGCRPYHHLGVSAFADHIVVSERSAVRIDEDIPFDIAALFGCAVLTGAGAALHAAQVRPGDTVAVVGLGGVGLAALLAARAAGAAEIIAVDLVAAKRERALELGASHAVVGGEEASTTIREITEGGADHVIETTGVPAALEGAYAATRPGGITVTVGLPEPDSRLTLPALSLVAEERTLRGSYLGSCVPQRDVPRFVDMYRAGLLPVDALLSHRLDLTEINTGFDRLATGEALRQVVLF
ncbi:zinc-binding dehydrogenase [Lipingzhangella sp. LS1_29]|uniref:Zinc-binding dehydrogenase n=1 Tax=Lipingzhangella rawalii TaxID=2055835 RepID=A0ABU2H2X8_9ACTN|nr:zinc-binding dehydrogenase [Lipingzhangella rawalii]MDS1268984.1 zinc-binding dehydrogenase [Lipingzhangella rawalii]